MLPGSQDKNMQKWPDRENLIACCNLIPFKYESETSHKETTGIDNINAETKNLMKLTPCGLFRNLHIKELLQ